MPRYDCHFRCPYSFRPRQKDMRRDGRVPRQRLSFIFLPLPLQNATKRRRRSAMIRGRHVECRVLPAVLRQFRPLFADVFAQASRTKAGCRSSLVAAAATLLKMPRERGYADIAHAIEQCPRIPAYVLPIRQKMRCPMRPLFVPARSRCLRSSAEECPAPLFFRAPRRLFKHRASSFQRKSRVFADSGAGAAAETVAAAQRRVYAARFKARRRCRWRKRSLMPLRAAATASTTARLRRRRQ